MRIASRRAFVLLGIVLVWGATAGPVAAQAPPSAAAEPASKAAEPPGIETATSRWGSARVFRASYVSSLSPVPLITLHSWTVHVRDAAGRPVDGAELTVVGGMPEHTHGFPTVPQVIAVGGGDYRVDGLKFHMPGRWSVIVRIARGADETDSVRFDLDVR